jgi:predicted membrane GTPase involved in stress response
LVINYTKYEVFTLTPDSCRIRKKVAKEQQKLQQQQQQPSANDAKSN